ncbi:MAG: hypothetical protein U9R27_10480 [Campylobacterota bacterium]|nr:hypothetical protein [Campylobacterota bacterium]
MELEKPGDGLPKMEQLFIKNILVPMVRVFFTWDIALLLLKREVKIIKNLVTPLTNEQCTRQVIIDRAFAIEDDTRQFSVNLALEHLTITGSALMGVIHALSKEREFKKSITIEGVKPHENKTEQLEGFLKSFSSKSGIIKFQKYRVSDIFIFRNTAKQISIQRSPHEVYPSPCPYRSDLFVSKQRRASPCTATGLPR